MKFVLGYITTKNKQESERIGRSLLKEKLIECVNIIDNVNSIYWWQERIKNNQESLMIVKTKKSLSQEIIKKVKSLHSYTCPCIIFLPIEAGNPDYLNYIDNSTK